MSLLILLMLLKRKDIFWYPCPLKPIRTENSRKRWSCLFISYNDTYSSFKTERTEKSEKSLWKKTTKKKHVLVTKSQMLISELRQMTY